jgi:hypothetical protein
MVYGLTVHMRAPRAREPFQHFHLAYAVRGCADLAAAGVGADVAAEPSEHERRMGQLLERRSVAELEQLLADRLAELAAARKIMREGSGGR